MLSQTARLTGMTEDFLFNIQSGYLKGFEAYRAYGLQDSCVIGENNFLWEGREEYTYPTANEKMYIKSDSPSDNIIIKIQGLYEDINGDWIEKVVEVTLNGTTFVTLPEMEFIRINRLDNISNQDNIGTIELHNTDGTIDITTLKARINPLRNRTEMAMYSVPSKYHAFVYRLYRSVRKNQDADFNYQVREFNTNFKTIGTASSFENSSQEDVSFEPFPPKTDFRILIRTENNNTEARGSFHLILVKEEHLELSRIEKLN